MVEAFAQKFSDVRRPYTVLYGAELFSSLMPSRTATIFRLRQVLLNTQLRLRDVMARSMGEPDQFAPVIARFAGPLRACAATLRELRGEPALPPKYPRLQARRAVSTSFQCVPEACASLIHSPTGAAPLMARSTTAAISCCC